MKKVTMTITMMIEENEDNLEYISELKEAIDSKAFDEGFSEGNDGITAESVLLIEDV